MNFYSNFEIICRKNSTTPTAVVKQLQLSTSKITAWKNGSIPKAEILEKLAKYFDISVSCFFADEKVIPTTDEENLLNLFRQLDSERKNRLLSDASDMVAAQIREKKNLVDVI